MFADGNPPVPYRTIRASLYYERLMCVRWDNVYIVSLLAIITSCSARPHQDTGQDIGHSLGSLRDSIASNEISVHEVVKKPSVAGAVSSWPSGDYCIMPGQTFKCPEGFYMGSISLAVPMSFGTRETYHEDNMEVPFIRLGRIGGFNLGLREYDQAYILRLHACCKVPET